jgi:hypothetical protein
VAQVLSPGERAAAYSRYLIEAEALAAELAAKPRQAAARAPTVDFGELQFFAL